MHREAASFPFFALPRLNIIVASMWVIFDFRADNGATLIASVSYTWFEDKQAQLDAVIRAQMPAGLPNQASIRMGRWGFTIPPCKPTRVD